MPSCLQTKRTLRIHFRATISSYYYYWYGVLSLRVFFSFRICSFSMCENVLACAGARSFTLGDQRGAFWRKTQTQKLHWLQFSCASYICLLWVYLCIGVSNKLTSYFTLHTNRSSVLSLSSNNLVEIYFTRAWNIS